MHNLRLTITGATLIFCHGTIIPSWGQDTNASSVVDPMISKITFAPIVKKVAPATVTVAQIELLEGVILEKFNALDPDERRIVLNSGEYLKFGDELGRYKGHGSGFIIDGAGHIVTNHHVVEGTGEGDNTFAVAIANGPWVRAKLVGNDPSTDIAVVKIEPPITSIASWGDSSKLQQGDIVLAIGTPRDLDLRQTVTMGVVSALGRANGGLRYTDFIQTDASINGGNSGGPLINTEGQVVGVNQSILLGMVEKGDGSAAYGESGGGPLRGSGNIGIGFAIPSSLAKKVAEDIIQNGRVIRGFIGLKVEEGSAPMGEGKDALILSGLRVSIVMTGSPAEIAGLKSGDLLLSFAGNPVYAPRQLHLAISLAAPGLAVPVEILRDGKRVTLSPVLGDLAATPYARIGFGAETLEAPTIEGVIFKLVTSPDGRETAIAIVSVEPMSRAAAAGLVAPCLLLKVAGVPISNEQSFNAVTSTSVAGGHILLTVRERRGEKTVSVPVTLKPKEPVSNNIK